MLCVFCTKTVSDGDIGFQSPHATQFGMCSGCKGSKHAEWRNELAPSPPLKLPGSAQSRKQARVRAYVDMVKSSGSCLDCGRTFDPVCMDFDHRPGYEKRREVSACKTLQQAQEEIAKCDLICACCHRLRTKVRARGIASTLAGQ